MVTLAPTIAPERVVSTSNVAASGDGGTTSETIVEGGSAGSAGSTGGPGVTLCPGPQIEGDPYSPECRSFAAGANNGGATAKGVTKDTITVAFRDLGGSYDIGATIGSLTGKRVDTGSVTLADVVRTYETLIKYFNKNFQFYGRKIELKVFRGQSSGTDELLGGGQGGANADAIYEAQQIKAFADVGGFEAPVFAEALAKQGVISTNVVYPDIGFYRKNAPYAWGVFPDCTKVANMLYDFIVKQLADFPVITGEFKGKPRKLGLVYPEAPAYQGCGDLLKNKLKEAGKTLTSVRQYRLSLDGIPPDARDIASAFANEGVTSVILACDPLMPYFMTATAEQSGWQPEWVNLGIAFMDTDFAGQLYEQNQWKNAFGLSLNGPTQPARATTAYAAYRSIDPTTSPVALLVEPIYYQLYTLAIGLHMAGPNLTPENFGKGMHSYKSAQAVGPAGAWSFADDSYTAPIDTRIIYWDPNAISAYNGQKGAYKDTGPRYKFGGMPAGQTDVPLGK